MITPLFSVRQDDQCLHITVRTPYVKAEELELEVDEYNFRFFVKPYFLSLTFKQPLGQVGLPFLISPL